MPEYSIKIRVPVIVDKIFVWPILGLRWIWYGYTFRRVKLIPDKYAIVDSADFDEVSKYIWWAKENCRKYVAVRFLAGGNCGRAVYMHRQLMKPPKNKLVDHINRNPLDNRRANLRIVTQSQNNMNRSGRRGTSSKYKGVSWYSSRNCWRAMIQVNKKGISLGYFDSETQAARAYDLAAKKYHRKFAYLNFNEDNGPRNLRARIKRILTMKNLKES